MNSNVITRPEPATEGRTYSYAEVLNAADATIKLWLGRGLYGNAQGAFKVWVQLTSDLRDEPFWREDLASLRQLFAAYFAPPHQAAPGMLPDNGDPAQPAVLICSGCQTPFYEWLKHAGSTCLDCYADHQLSPRADVSK